MIIIISLLLFAALIAISAARFVGYLRERRRHRCIRRIAAFVASPIEFDVDRLLLIGHGVSTQTIIEAAAYAVEHLHPATKQRMVMVVKFYGLDFYLIEQLKRGDSSYASLLLSKIPISRDAEIAMRSMQANQPQS